MIWLAGIVVAACGLWLIGLAVAIVVVPAKAENFLLGSVSSARAHYTEQPLRLLAGVAIVIFAARMRFTELFTVLGWLLVLTSAGLLLTPWRWHRRFGQWAIPLAIRHLKLYALGAFALGSFILHSAF